MEGSRNPNAEQPEFGDYSVPQILSVFSPEEILDVHDYYLDNIGSPQILFDQPLPPGFAPDKTEHHAMLTHNRLSSRSARATQLYRQDTAVKAILSSMPSDSERQAKLKAQQALRTCNVTLACIALLEQEAREAIEEQRETEPA